MKKVLVVVDMQVDFTTGCLGNAECVAAVPEVVKVIRSGEYDKVFVTKDTHQTDYMSTQEGQRLPVPHCIENTEGWEIHDEVWKACVETYSEKEIVTVCKPNFGSIDLGMLLQAYAKSIDGEELEVYFVGVCTGICVISNVMIAKATIPEVRVCVIEKACACVTPETHKTAIEAMKNCQVDIV